MKTQNRIKGNSGSDKYRRDDIVEMKTLKYTMKEVKVERKNKTVKSAR